MASGSRARFSCARCSSKATWRCSGHSGAQSSAALDGQLFCRRTYEPSMYPPPPACRSTLKVRKAPVRWGPALEQSSAHKRKLFFPTTLVATLNIKFIVPMCHQLPSLPYVHFWLCTLPLMWVVLVVA